MLSYAAQRRYSPDAEIAWMETYRIDDVSCDDLPRGVLVGSAAKLVLSVLTATSSATEFLQRFSQVRKWDYRLSNLLQSCCVFCEETNPSQIKEQKA